jgi:hypothetical protein
MVENAERKRGRRLPLASRLRLDSKHENATVWK